MEFAVLFLLCLDISFLDYKKQKEEVLVGDSLCDYSL